MAKEENKGDKENAEKKKASKGDQLTWYLLILALLFLAGSWLGGKAKSPWGELITAVQVLCVIAAVALAIKTYPHPLRTLNKKLARERQDLKRQKKKKKKKW